MHALGRRALPALPPGRPREQDLSRLAARFASTAGGAGPGLSLVRAIVAAHHGPVSAEPGEGGGLKVTVDLP